MFQKTLITLYGSKLESFCNYVYTLQDIVIKAISKDIFRPYHIEQIHGTLIGMESVTTDKLCFNKNLWESEGKRLEMDFTNLKGIINSCFPMQIRFGGFSSDDHSFLSRGELPYHRSFSIDAENRRIVLIGWPHIAGDFSCHQLLNFRKRMKKECNVAHKYAFDNDFYLVLGEFQGENEVINKEKLVEIQEKIRGYMANNPIDIELNDSNLQIARYSDIRLPLETTKTSAIEQFIHEKPERI